MIPKSIPAPPPDTVDVIGSVIVTSSALPTGAATAANQVLEIALLTTIDAGIPAALGQTTMANSMPVVIASDQTPIPVSGTISVTGGLTDAQLRASPVPISGTITGITNPVAVTGAFFQATQPVSIAGTVAVSGPLTDTQLRATPVPISGTVTANAGTNLNTSLLALETGGNLAAIKAKTDNIPALGQALAAASVPVVLTAAQLTTLTPLTTVAVTQSTSPWVTNDPGLPNALGQSNMAGSTSVVLASDQSAVHTIIDSGSVTVSGSITANVEGDYVDDSAFTVATDRGLIVGGTFTTDSIDAGDFGAFKINAKRELFVVQDTAANLSATVVQATGTNLHVVVDSGLLNVNNVLGTVAVSSTQLPAALGQQVMVASFPVVIASNQTAIPVTGTFFQATQPVSLASGAAVSGALADGAIVTLGAKTDAKSTATDATSITAMQVLKQISASVQAPPSQAVTNAGTFAVQATQTTSPWIVAGGGTAGTAATGVVTVQGIASMTKLLVTPDSVALPANQSVNVSQINSVTPLMGSGIMGTGSPRVTIASDNDALTVKQATGTNLHMVVDSGTITTVSTVTAVTTVSTVSAVTAITNALPVGANVIGKVSIDQATPGTTNLVALTAETTKVIGTVNQGTSPWVVSGSLTTAEAAPTTIFNGKTTVTTAGTRVVLAASTTVKSVTIKALAANTGIIYVGNATVAAANGHPLNRGQSVSMDIANLNTVNIDSSVNGEGVTYLAVN